MPFGSPSCFTSWPYSVIQMRTFLRLNHLSSDFSKRGNDASVTFGHFTFWSGFIRTGTGYGCCAHASNFSRGFAAATSCAKRPGECVADLPFEHLVAAGRRRAADRDLRVAVAGLDARVGGGGELRVVPRRDRPALRVELRREEELQVRLVPDRVEAHVREARVAARVALRDGARERGQVAQPPRQEVRRLAAVRPLRRAPDRDQDLQVARLRVPDELVEIVEAVGRVERVRRRSRAAWARRSPR